MIRIATLAAVGWLAPSVPALAQDLTPDEVAMIVGTMLVATKTCELAPTDAPLNVAIANLGQDLVDFGPNERYAPLVNVKVKKAQEWVEVRGTAPACADFAETLQRFLPDIFP